MSELHATQVTAEEASRRIAADIRAYPPGPDKREEHLRLYSGVLSRDDIEGAWADRYAEIALAGRGKLARVGARFDALRPRIEEAKRKSAEPKVVGYRRYAKATNNGGVSFSVPAHNLRLMKRKRTRQGKLPSPNTSKPIE